jgi:hypothetical protein
MAIVLTKCTSVTVSSNNSGPTASAAVALTDDLALVLDRWLLPAFAFGSPERNRPARVLRHSASTGSPAQPGDMACFRVAQPIYVN